MSYSLRSEVRNVPAASLVLDPRNGEVHQDFDPGGRDSELIADVKRNGVLLPVLLRPDGKTIADGHRRVRAALAAGVPEVPAIILASEEESTFRSAQLGRNLSLFAQCVLYRNRIESLVEQGKDRKRANLTDDECVDEVDEAWIVLEQVLGRNRLTLQRGAQLLQWIDENGDPRNPRQARTAGQVYSTFRNRGLRPAMYLSGLWNKGESPADTDDDTDSCEPSPETWPQASPQDKRKRVRAPVAEAPADEAVDESEDEPAIAGRICSGDDSEAAMIALDTLYDYLRDLGVLTPDVEIACGTIRAAIRGWEVAA